MVENGWQMGRRALAGLTSGVLVVGLTAGLAHADVAGSWEAKALFLQHRIDRAVPLRLATFPHTHNSYNNTEDSRDRSGSYNHKLSLRNQLNYGIRSLTFDVIEDAGQKLCHGACLVTDMTFKEGLDKIINFLNERGNEKEVIHLRLAINPPGTNTGDWLGKLRRALVDKIGNRIYTPKMFKNGVSGSCVDFSEPANQITKATIIAAGKNLIITSDEACKKNQLDDWVFRGDFNPTINLKKDGADFSGFPNCSIAGKGISTWTGNFVRFYESRLDDDHKDLDYKDVHKLLGCGINAVAPAPLVSDSNAHRGQVWSWAEGYPQASAGPTFAFIAYDDKAAERRIKNTTQPDPNRRLFAACRTAGQAGTTTDGALWKLSTTKVAEGRANGEAACAALPGGSYTFAVPYNGYEMKLLVRVIESMSLLDVAPGVWVNYENARGTADINGWVATTRYQ
jgi:hypothetical protein